MMRRTGKKAQPINHSHHPTLTLPPLLSLSLPPLNPPTPLDLINQKELTPLVLPLIVYVIRKK